MLFCMSIFFHGFNSAFPHNQTLDTFFFFIRLNSKITAGIIFKFLLLARMKCWILEYMHICSRNVDARSSRVQKLPYCTCVKKYPDVLVPFSKRFDNGILRQTEAFSGKFQALCLLNESQTYFCFVAQEI